MNRIESDFLGSREIPQNALYGIHSLRARENFPNSGEKHAPEMLKAYLMVKKACFLAAKDHALLEKEIHSVLIQACDFFLQDLSRLEPHIIVPSVSGGAGTSLNMNLNEILANQALLFSGNQLGDYTRIHPNHHANIAQSTNDTYPTALKIAAIFKIRELTETVCSLQEGLQEKEKQFSSVLKPGRTQMRNAVPMTLGQAFGTFAEMISRDRWRLYKAEERLRVVNLGGTAIGTGVNAPRAMTFQALEILRGLCGIGLARAENLMDATSNQDEFAEVFGWIKTLALNLFKMAQDLRFLSASPVEEISLPEVQAGSSIMPGKVNPVILETLIQSVFQILGADTVIASCVMHGNEQLNPWLPLLGHTFLSALNQLNQSLQKFTEKCLPGITACPERCQEHLLASSMILTRLSPMLGYEKTAELVKETAQKGKSLDMVLREKEIVLPEELQALLNPESQVRFRD